MLKVIALYGVSTFLSTITAMSFGYDPLMVLMAATTAAFTVVHLPATHWLKGIMTVLVITMLAINLAPGITSRFFDSDSLLTSRGIAIVIALFAQGVISLVWGQLPQLKLASVIEDALRAKLNARQQTKTDRK